MRKEIILLCISAFQMYKKECWDFVDKNDDLFTWNGNPGLELLRQAVTGVFEYNNFGKEEAIQFQWGCWKNAKWVRNHKAPKNTKGKQCIFFGFRLNSYRTPSSLNSCPTNCFHWISRGLIFACFMNQIFFQNRTIYTSSSNTIRNTNQGRHSYVAQIRAFIPHKFVSIQCIRRDTCSSCILLKRFSPTELRLKK